MSSQFRVCTYNMGHSIKDYFHVCNYQDPSFSEEEEAFSRGYRRAEETTALLLSTNIHVYCLQEVDTYKRPLLRALDGRFEIIHFHDPKQPSHFDTAIALDTERFEKIENHSIKHEGMDVAIAIATDRVSKQRFTFVSAHVPGYDLSDATPQEIRPGVALCDVISKKIESVAQGTLRVIGADMNAYPEIEQRRFQSLSKNQCTLIRTNEPTNVRVSDETEPLHELDFVFATLSSWWERFKAIFFSSVICTAKVNKEHRPLAWDREQNASDHLPVFVDFSVETRSKIKQLFSALCNYKTNTR